MRFKTHQNQLILSDRPDMIRMFGLLFIVVGLPVLPLGICADDLGPIRGGIVAVLGGASLLVGIAVIVRTPHSVVRLDQSSGGVTIVRRSFPRARVYRFERGQIIDVVVEESDDDERDRIWRPAIRTTVSGDVPLSMHWYHSRGDSDRLAAIVRDFLKSPSGPVS